MKKFPAVRSALAAAAFCLFAGAAQADLIGGVEFPDGVSSFADAVESFSPAAGPTAPHLDANNSLGVPDYAGVNSCPSAPACSFASLGSGGTLIVEFVDNRLTGSGSAAEDLWIFEVGPDIEDTFVSISKDGVVWHDVGKVFGSTAGIDIDAFGWGVDDRFRFVRLRDDPDEGGTRGITAGADIDAVGAVSSVPAIPEPETWALFALGALAMGLHRRRAAKAAKKPVA